MAMSEAKAAGAGAGAGADTKKAMAAVACVWLLVIMLAGIAVLAWWSVVFHPDKRQLWMVPVSLIMVGTPLIIWLSYCSASVTSCHVVPKRTSTVVLPDPDPEK